MGRGGRPVTPRCPPLVHTRGSCSASCRTGKSPLTGCENPRPQWTQKVYEKAGQARDTASVRPDRNLRMHVNGRLTAPPEFQAELATNSVRRNLLQGSFDRPEARGNPLDIFSPRTLRPSAFKVQAFSGNSSSASAAQFLFGTKEGAAAS